MATRMTHSRLHRFDQIALAQLRALDRERTVVLLPVGMLEEHGDHLPFGTDNFAVDALTLAAASWLLEDDHDLHILLLPTLPYGTDPVDLRREDLFAAAGSVWIDPDTLKALVTDILEHVIRFGFRGVFPISFHGGPRQSIVLEEVCAELRARHPGLVIYEPSGYVMAGAELDVTPGLATLLGRPLSPSEEVALKGSIHGSMFETSMMLHLRPELVDPSYKRLRTIEWNQVYTMPDWPGYVGAGPAHANADVGAAVLRWRGVRAGALIRRAMDGEDLSTLPRHPTWLDDLKNAQTVREAPGEEELPSRQHAGPDSKPAMFISREALADARAEAEARAGEGEAGEVVAEPPLVTDTTVTPPSAAFETRPGQSRPSPEDEPPSA